MKQVQENQMKEKAETKTGLKGYYL